MFPPKSPARSLAPAVFRLAILSLVLPSTASRAAQPLPSAGDQANENEPWLAMARRYCDQIADAETRSNVFYDLAYVQARAGKFADARASAAQIIDPAQQVSVLAFIARRCHDAGDSQASRSTLEQAREIATKTAGPDAASYGHNSLIEAYVEIGLPQDAHSFIPTLSPRFGPDLEYMVLATALSKSGDVDGALAVVRRLTSDNWPQALSHVAKAASTHRGADAALDLAEQLDKTEDRDRAYAELAEALAAQGRFAKAEQLAGRIESKDVQAKARGKVLAKWADTQPAQAIAQRLDQVKTREEKTALYLQLIEKLAADEGVVEAEQAIEAMVDVIRRSPRPAENSAFGRGDDNAAIAFAKAKYLLTARALAEQGEQAAAQKRVQWAAEAIVGLAPETGLGKMLSAVQLVRGQIEIGDLDGARRVIDKLDERFRSMPAVPLAIAFVRAGDMTSAIAVANQISNEGTGSGDFLGNVAEAMILEGEIAAAKDLLADLGPSAEEAKAYRAAGSALLETGRSAELHDWLAEMAHPAHQAYACIGAAEALCKKQ